MSLLWAMMEYSRIHFTSIFFFVFNKNYEIQNGDEGAGSETSFGPRQANLVLIAYASSEGSGEPAHSRSLARTLLLAHTSSESRGVFRQKARSLAPLNAWACAVKICHDGMLEDTNPLDGAYLTINADFFDYDWIYIEGD